LAHSYEFLSKPILSRGIHAAKLAYSYHGHWGLTVLFGVLKMDDQDKHEQHGPYRAINHSTTWPVRPRDT